MGNVDGFLLRAKTVLETSELLFAHIEFIKLSTPPYVCG